MDALVVAAKAPSVRAPRGLLKANGIVMQEVSFEADTNSFYTADTFRAVLAVAALPPEAGPDWWVAQGQIEVELFAGYSVKGAPPSVGDMNSIFLGLVDDLDWQVEDGLISISGRDYAGQFIDNKTVEKYPENTASEIATKLAKARGLTPVVTATKTKVGRYYKDARIQLQDDRTEWDLLTWLAREEGFLVYVKGRELHFEPPPSAGDQYALKVTYTYGNGAPDVLDGAERLKLSHSFTAAKDITVIVRSYNSKQKKGFEVDAKRNRAQNRTLRKGTKTTTPAQIYTYNIPGLTKDQAQAKANQLLAELTQHEMRLELESPGNIGLGLTDKITLSGTKTAWDQDYFPDSITRSLDVDGGLHMRLNAKNHSPESAPSL